MELREILTTILGRVGLTKPDGRPLYAYRLDEALLFRLGDALRTMVHRGGALDRVDAALLCLYAAEQLSRRYSGGTRSFELAFEGLEQRGVAFDPDPAFRSWIVREGLRFLRRDVMQLPSGAQGYLLSLVCEGGFPRQLLARERAGFTCFFRRLLEDAERLPGADLGELAKAHGHRLPESFRHPDVYWTAAELVGAVVALRQKLPEACPRPVAWLDEHAPDWRSRIPLAVEDDTARRLLEGLMSQSRPTDDHAAPLRLHTVLELPRDGEGRVGRILSASPQVDRARFADWINVEEGALPSFGTVHIEMGPEQRWLCGRWEPYGQSSLRLVVQRANLPGAPLTETPRLRFSADGEELARLELDAQGFEGLPWVFRHSDRGGLRMVGEGALRTRAEEVWVVAGEDVDRAQRGVVEHRRLADGRWALRVRGELSFLDDRVSSLIQTGTSNESEAIYRLIGEHPVSGLAHVTAWVGPPRVQRRVGEALMSVSSTDIEVRPRHGEARRWRPSAIELLGEVEVRVRDRQGPRLRRRALILPPDFRVTRRQGALELQSRALRGVIAQGAEAWAVEPVDGGFRLRPPSSVDRRKPVVLRVDFGNDQIALLSARVPGPLAGFVTSTGRELAGGEHISARQLGSLRVEMFETPNQRVELEIRAPSGRRLYRAVPSEVGRQLFLDAFEPIIRAALATGVRVDDAVELRITTAPGEVVRVRRYEVGLELELSDPDRVEMYAEDEGGFPLEARPVDDPLAEPLLVPEHVPARWSSPIAELPDGALLFTAPPPHRERLRPLARFIRPVERPADALQAAALADLSPEARSRLMAKLWLEALAEPDTPVADRLLAMVRTLDSLPPNTFHAVVALERVPEAAVWCWLRSSAAVRPVVWEGLERLDFAWWLIPLEAWRRGVEAYAAWLRTRLVGAETPEEGVEALTREAIDKALDGAQARLPMLTVLRTRLAEAGLPVSAASGDEAALLGMPPAVIDQLLGGERTEAEARWRDRQRPVTSDELARALGKGQDPLHAGPVWLARQILGGAVPRPLVFDLRILRAFDPGHFDWALGLSLARAGYNP